MIETLSKKLFILYSLFLIINFASDHNDWFDILDLRANANTNETLIIKVERPILPDEYKEHNLYNIRDNSREELNTKFIIGPWGPSPDWLLSYGHFER